MATTRHELIDELLITRRQAQRLAISLRFQGHDTAAIAAQEKEKELTDQIDTLLAADMATWVQNAVDMATRLKSINQRLSASVESVRRREEKAGQIAAALGALDDVIGMLRRLAT
jgi:hypothetical protein